MGFHSRKHLVVVSTVCLKEFLQQNMLYLVNSFWGSLWSYFLHVFSFISRYFLGIYDQRSMEIEVDIDDLSGETDQGICETAGEKECYDQFEEQEIPKLDYEGGSVCNAVTSKYQFFAGNSVCSFVEQPQTVNFTVQEMVVMSNDMYPCKLDCIEGDDSSFEAGFSVDLIGNSVSPDVIVESQLVEHGFSDELSGELEVVESKKTEDSVCDINIEDPKLEQKDCADLSDRSSDEHDHISQDELLYAEHNDSDNLGGAEEVVEHDHPSVELETSEDDRCEEPKIANLEEERHDKVEVLEQVHSSVAESNDFWATIYKYDSYSLSSDEEVDYDEISCHKIPSMGFEPETPMCMGDLRVDYDEDSPSSLDDSPLDQDNSQLDDIGVDNEHVDSPYIELKPQPYSSIVYAAEHIPSDEFSDSDDEFDTKNSTFGCVKGIDSSESCDEGDDQMEGDVLLEQKELIRQMKREMRQLKINGLPTILEESESPRVEDDLRPLRIDERIGHKDRMDEIHTFYKRYLDKMRKLDILSQQTMYAIGLLQLKSQDQFSLNKKVSVPVIKSLVAQNIWSHKLRKREADPVQKLIKDLQTELELVYVGQLCLSWEILKWQHRKVEELHAHDPDGFRQYNQVAGEFQKFQVLLQRFTEDEPFHQGPRVQQFPKTRCGHPNLLQVPLIKDDPKTEWRGDGEGVISVDMLKEVVAASMRSFWDFLRADKDETHAAILMGVHGPHVDLQDPSDAELLTEIRSTLQKKEKRLKDLVRSGNCLVRKFQKHQDQRLSHEMFLAQVELRVVSRVLNMSKLTTDQLLWCHKKMNKINVVGRKVYIEFSFSLFPC